MYEYHSWADIFHHCTYLFTVSRGITVNLAFTATGLAVAFGAIVKTPMGIVQEVKAVIT